MQFTGQELWQRYQEYLISNESLGFKLDVSRVQFRADFIEKMSSAMADAFKAIVPVLIGIALVMVVFQPRLSKFVAARQRARGVLPAEDAGTGLEAPPSQVGGPVLWTLVFLSGVYGGYFGAAQGVLLLGLMGVAFTDSLQRINAVKNVLAGLVNGVAALVFIFATHVDWAVAGLIACGAILGGQFGARIGRRLPPWALRLVIICIGVIALVKLLA